MTWLLFVSVSCVLSAVIAPLVAALIPPRPRSPRAVLTPGVSVRDRPLGTGRPTSGSWPADRAERAAEAG